MLLSEVCTYLATQGIGTSGTNLFYGPMQEQYPDAVVVVEEYGGFPDEPNLGDGGPTSGQATRLEYPAFRVLCRGTRDDYDGPRAKAVLAKAALMKVVNETMSSCQYLGFDVGPLIPLRPDSNFRHSITFNVHTMKEPS